MQLAENDKFAYPHSVEQTSIYDWKALKKIHTKKKKSRICAQLGEQTSLAYALSHVSELTNTAGRDDKGHQL